MEIFLNLLWLALAVIALVVWRVRNHDHGAAELRREGVALLFVLVLMFFVISMTDDLHAEIILTEDYSFVRRQAALVSSSHHLLSAAKVGCHQAAVLLPLFISPEYSIPILSAAQVLPVARVSAPISGRSPPGLTA